MTVKTLLKPTFTTFTFIIGDYALKALNGQRVSARVERRFGHQKNHFFGKDARLDHRQLSISACGHQRYILNKKPSYK